jgi:outer membrane protein OmpA-like peptidoglycan-associated protein
MNASAALRLPHPLPGGTRDRATAVALLVLGFGDLAVLNLWAFPRALARPSAPVPVAVVAHLPLPLPVAVPDSVPVAAQPSRPVEAVDGTPERPVAVLYFGTGGAEIAAGQAALLDRLARQLPSLLSGESKVVLEGHADARGSARFNHTLSLRRARAAARRLALQGIPREVIQVTAYGANRSRGDAANPPSLDGDRRVEIYLRRGAP